jgi:glycosyltransferase involved in cell wall biosynthesis
MKTLVIVCPVHNEEESVDYFYERVNAVVADLSSLRTEILFINNASTDTTLEKILALRAKDPRVQVVSHSRNFGYQASVTCGLKHASGDAYVIIDVDCEDPPEMIRDFVRLWQQGYDIVYGLRAARPEATHITGMRKLFYRLTHAIADADFIVDMAEFSLFTDRVKRQMLRHRSTFPFVRSDLAFVGFNRIGIPYTREPRRFGATHYNLVRMTKFAIAGILSTSTFPLRLTVYVGIPLAGLNLLVSLLSLFGAAGRQNWLESFNWAFAAAALASLATYLARVSKDVVGRPVFIVDDERTHLNRPAVLEGQESIA